MKLDFNVKKLILIFFCLNLFIASALVYILVRSNEVKLFSADISKQVYSISSLPSQISEQLKVGSNAFIIYDPLSRNILAGKNEKLRFAPASTVKIMTALISLENYDLKQIFTAKNISLVDGSKMRLVEGEMMSVENLLYGMMLPSGNDAAFVLANSFPSGYNGFIGAMNLKAKELELDNTKFVDSAGLDDKNYSTAFDLARLAAYAMQKPNFAKVVGTRFVSVTDTSGKNVHDLYNLNELLGIEGVNGVKTGFTDEAGGVLVTSLNRSGRNYIIVVLASKDRFGDTYNVIEEAVKKIRTLFY